MDCQFKRCGRSPAPMPVPVPVPMPVPVSITIAACWLGADDGLGLSGVAIERSGLTGSEAAPSKRARSRSSFSCLGRVQLMGGLLVGARWN